VKYKKYIILNFLHGNSPYLRTAELALAVNDMLEEKGFERFGIIVPWVYKIRQREIMRQNFRRVIKKHPNELLLDENLGGLLEPIFYNGENYEEWLRNFLANHKTAEEKIRAYLSDGITAKNFFGIETKVEKNNIEMEINRCPIVDFGIRPSYYTSFAYYSDILSRSLKEDAIAVSDELIRKGIEHYESIEKKQALHFIADPATFSYLNEMPRKYDTETYTPPNSSQSLQYPFYRYARKGVYVTVTGIYGMEHLFEELHNTGFNIYTHKPGRIPFSIRATPSIMSRRNIKLHFARVGWGSAWLSFFSKTPLIAMPYHTADEPEVFFNNICVEKLGIGKVFRGEHINELLKFGEEYQKNIAGIGKKLMDKYGTLEGVEYTARRIVSHYLNK
jgi:hypothetical protein